MAKSPKQADRCQCLTKNNTQCKRKKASGSKYCGGHKGGKCKATRKSVGSAKRGSSKKRSTKKLTKRKSIQSGDDSLFTALNLSTKRTVTIDPQAATTRLKAVTYPMPGSSKKRTNYFIVGKSGGVNVSQARKKADFERLRDVYGIRVVASTKTATKPKKGKRCKSYVDADGNKVQRVRDPVTGRCRKVKAERKIGRQPRIQDGESVADFKKRIKGSGWVYDNAFDGRSRPDARVASNAAMPKKASPKARKSPAKKAKKTKKTKKSKKAKKFSTPKYSPSPKYSTPGASPKKKSPSPKKKSPGPGAQETGVWAWFGL